MLLIEDDRDTAETLADLLTLSGHACKVARDGPSGVVAAREWCPELILCDLGLPGMDGYEVGRAIRADPALANVRLIALSGYARPEDLQRSAEAGFDGHLAKPPDLAKLEALLGS